MVNTNPYAVIVGADDTRGVYAARTLHNHNIPVIGIAKNLHSYGCRTRAYEAIYQANTDSEELIDTLEELASTFNQMAVIVPCLDTSVLTISRHRHRLAAHYHITLPDPNVVEMLTDKAAFYTYAMDAGFPIPKTRVLYSLVDAEKAAQELSFPCILKPSTSKSPRWLQQTNLKAFKATNARELLKFYNYYHQWADALIAQEWIEGSDADLYACHCYFDQNSQPLATFTSRKLRQWPPETGEGSIAEECMAPFVRDETIRLFQSVAFRGLGYLELKFDSRHDRYFIVEPNIGRASGRMAIAEAGGVALLQTMYCDNVGWPLPKNRDQRYGHVKWIHSRRDFQSAFYYWKRGELSLLDWWRSWRGPKVDALFSWRDPGPFIGDLCNAARLFSLKSERQKRNPVPPITEPFATRTVERKYHGSKKGSLPLRSR